MDRLQERLAKLDPPLGHQLEWRDDGLLITLVDPDHHARVSRLIRSNEMHDIERVNLVLLHAINELRRKGAQVPLDKDTVLLTKLPNDKVGSPS